MTLIDLLVIAGGAELLALVVVLAAMLRRPPAGLRLAGDAPPALSGSEAAASRHAA